MRGLIAAFAVVASLLVVQAAEAHGGRGFGGRGFGVNRFCNAGFVNPFNAFRVNPFATRFVPTAHVGANFGFGFAHPGSRLSLFNSQFNRARAFGFAFGGNRFNTFGTRTFVDGFGNVHEVDAFGNAVFRGSAIRGFNTGFGVTLNAGFAAPSFGGFAVRRFSAPACGFATGCGLVSSRCGF